ncbi:MAG: alpha-1,2-fucosyltransferase [Patescibacteria group bacterium]
MIIIKIEGGLGNQMFQYALGRNLSLTHGKNFKIDTSYLRKNNQSGRTFRLSGFKIVTTEATKTEINRYRSTLEKFFDRIRPRPNKKKVLELSNTFDPEVLKRTDGYLVGHWNDARYFESSENTILEDFKLQKPFGAAAEKMASFIFAQPEAVSVHIRRGDYVSIPKIADVHGALPLSYYAEACEIIMKKKPNAHFFISSDDIAWAKKNFPPHYPATFISDPEIPDYEEMTLMSLCKHHIIANSTFSWWAARLNQKKEKIIIAPKNWFRDTSKDASNLIAKNWIQI